MTDVPADVVAAIEALFNAARQGEELAVVGGLHANLVAAIAKAIEAARKQGIIVSRVERVPFTFDEE